MIWVAILKAVAMSYAVLGAVRARWVPGLVLCLSGIVTVLLPLAAATGSLASDLSSWILVAPWLLAVVALAGLLATRRTFAELDRAESGSRREEALSSAAYGLLANTLLDSALLVIALLALVLSSRGDGF